MRSGLRLALAALALAGPATAAAAGDGDPDVTLLAPCGHRLHYPDSGAVWNRAAARDEGGGVVGQMVEVTGDFSHRELELVDCRRGTEVFLGDVTVSSGTWVLPQGTPYQATLDRLRSQGGLRDAHAAATGFGTDAQVFALDVDWRDNVHAACMCEHFYPGTSGLPQGEVPAPDQVHGVDARLANP